MEINLNVLFWKLELHGGSMGSREVQPTRSLYHFPTADAKKYRKLSGLKQHKSILLQFWRPEAPYRIH